MTEDRSIIPYTIIAAMAQMDSVLESRLFGWVMAKAQAVNKLYQKDLSDINLAHALDVVQVTIPAHYLLPVGDTNYSQIRKAFKLATKTIHYEHEGLVADFNIIANPRFIKRNGRKLISFIIAREIWWAMLDFTKGYRLISLQTYMRLKSTYAIIMYVLVSQQTKPLTYSIETLRQTLGATSKAYERTANLIAKVIEPARRELDKASPFTFTYELERGGRGGGYKNITIRPSMNATFDGTLETPMERERAEELQRQRIRLDDRVTDYVLHGFSGTAMECERLERLILNIGSVSDQLSKLATIKEAADRRRVRNRMAYLTASLKNA